MLPHHHLRRLWVTIFAFPFVLGTVSAQEVTMVPGRGKKKTDCMAQLAVTGPGFPSETLRSRGVTCADGDACDLDGQRNNECAFSASLCINVPIEDIKQCKPPFDVVRFDVRGADPEVIEALEEALSLPSTTQDCATPLPITVAVKGPNKLGEFKNGQLTIKARTRARGGKKDKDRYRFVCRPAAPVVPPEPETPPVEPPPEMPPPAVPPPGPGLAAEILATTIGADGVVVTTFLLTDADGVRITPTTSSPSNPSEARLRFTIARIEVDPETVEGFTTTFTRYVNYITATQTSPITGDSSDQPTYDSGGTFALVDAETGTYTYTFATTLPAGYPATLTHTVGAQVERELAGEDLVANPIFDFVPAGGPVTTMREGTTTAQCNTCHDPLAIHGGGRREVRLCQLCHTDQAFDPDTGNTIDFRAMVHKIHRGKELPGVEEGPVGTKYSIIGFRQSEHTYSETVHTCEGGEYASVPCKSDTDCPGGTCTGEGTVGVGFPQDIRNCEKCHAEGATAENYATLPSTAACATCHDTVNPGQTPTEAGPPGTGHLAGAQPEAFCRLCHTPSGEEFGVSVMGAHTVPARSMQLAGLEAEILSASGMADGPVTIEFSLSEGDGSPLTSLSGLGSLSLAMSGPTTDLGGASLPLIRGTIPRSGDSPTGTYTYVVPTNLPADAMGTWRVGMEARRTVTVNDFGPCDIGVCANRPTIACTEDDDCKIMVNEAAQNPVLDFSVDGTPVSARREIVDIANCGSCHGTFSKDFSIHGSLRNQTEYCVVCHNANITDFDRRRRVSDANPVDETIHLKPMIHKIHTGEALEHKPYIIYGFGSPATPHDFSEVLYPGDRRNCATCHVDDSYLLPLPANVLPTRESEVRSDSLDECMTVVDPDADPVECVTGYTAATAAACLSCHDSDAARIHAETQTTDPGQPDAQEACVVCHGEGRIAPVSGVHATGP
jgi:OmcA/MtrC family decaheme c-type cytochrome